jgi:hypothetical protein
MAETSNNSTRVKVYNFFIEFLLFLSILVYFKINFEQFLQKFYNIAPMVWYDAKSKIN